MSMQVNSANSLSGIGTDAAGGQSLSRMFAELQMLCSNNAKRKATDLMNTIKEKQNKLKTAYAAKQAMQKALSKAGKKGSVDMLSEKFVNAKGNTRTVKGFLQYNKLGVTKTGKLHKEDIQAYIGRIDTYIQSLGTDTQTQMIRLQDYMGQYNNHLQGANKAISDGKQTLNAILSR
ncbi:hypothetical protein [Halodesulfovibrio spirochaetisodalis]|uniref:hypothetical protein n=1 Tax=Halodesulfovibrio spirochaetisodalis TaxID=1560234 RepID=UPI00082DE0DA|nr:hypothetical protein [Halodesulfovibrio spirochaetisodalis]